MKTKIPTKLPETRENRLGYKTYQPILNMKEPAREVVDFDPETGAVIETISIPSDKGDMVLEVHHYSLFDYLEERSAGREDSLFRTTSSKYLMGETDETRGVQRKGLMPEINLPDLMPKSLASIIGEGTGSLSIHGRSVTEMSGTSSFQKPEDTGLFRHQSKFPRLKLEQRQQINIEGVIGSKIHVFVDYNSQNEFQTNNRVEVKYVGEEDEILQDLELGDVNLSLPPSMLVAANIPRGNFGIKGETRLGALTTTFIASKEKGESAKKNIKIPISGQAEATDSAFFRDVNFSRNRHFLLIDPKELQNQFIKFLDRNGAPLKNESMRPTKVRIFKDDNRIENNNQGENQARSGVMYVDPTNIDPNSPFNEAGFFNEMEINKDFVLEQCGLAISFVGYVGDDEKVGAIYTEQSGTQVGNADGDTLRLKLIKSALMNPDNPSWTLMLRNVYSFGSGSAISPQSFSVDLFTNQTPPRYDESGRTFLDIFGLDNNADTKVDLIYIDFTRGLIFFPSLEPFNKPYDEENKEFPLLTRNNQMYVEDDPSRLNTLEFQKYNILVRYTRAEGSGSQTFDLGAMQIVENSERISLNDRLLRKDVDYSIDYQFGQLVLKPGLEIPPNSQVKVDFEQVPLFQTGNTSLFGFHNEYEFDPNRMNYLTSTLFVQNVESVDRSFVRLGDEPKSSVLGELGGKFEFDSDRLTEWLNKLPMLESRVPSRLNITGGLAVSDPNPNTRGGVLIEDFETSKIENPRLAMAYQSWRLSSVPKGSDGTFDLFDMNKAGNIFWFDPYFISQNYYGFYEADVYGTIEGRTQQNIEIPVSVMSFVFEPSGNNELERRQSWRSVVQPVSDTGVLGMNDRDFLQIYISTGRDQGKLIIDFGRVSEDQVRFNRAHELVGLGRLDTEDRNFDGRLDYNEDTGLDGVEGRDPPRDSTEPPVAGDDGNDDYFRPGENQGFDARYLNLTEGNNKGQIGASYDTEDLNHNGALDTQESVFRVQVDLKSLEMIPPPGVFIPTADRRVLVDEVDFDPNSDRGQKRPKAQLGVDNWYLLEIPLPKVGSRFENYYEKINNPSMSNILHVRLSFYDFAKNDTVNLAAINFVGNRFKLNDKGVAPRLEETFVDTLPSDTLWNTGTSGGTQNTTGLSTIGYHGLVEINSINTILNNDYYPPPSISETLNRYNRSGRSEDFTAQEAALSIRYQDLQRGYEGWALKAENNQQSYLDYAAMSFYLNSRQGPFAPKPTFFIRIGTDPDNFYEYSTVVDTGWTEVQVPFSGFLTLKDSLQGALDLAQIQSFKLDVKRGNFRIKGNPSLTKISTMVVGVSNENSDIPTTGEVWIDDVRLTNVIRELGLNSRLQVEAQLSDLGRVNVGISARDNKFRNLNESIPTNSTYSYTIGGSINLDRFTPTDWGLRLPVNLNTGYNLNLPRFHPGSEDVPIISSANKDYYKTESRNNSFNLSYTKTKGNTLAEKLLFDRLNGQISVSTARQTAPRNLSSSNSISSRFSYRATLPRDAAFRVFPSRLFGWMEDIPMPYFLKYNTLTKGVAGSKFRYLPDDFELTTSTDYRRNQSYDNASKLFRLDSVYNATNVARLQYKPFETIQSTFNIQTQRNLLETARGSKFLGIKIGNETARRQQLTLDLSPRAVSWLQPTLRYNTDYNNDHNPQYARSFGPNGDYRKFTSRNTQTFSIRFMLPQFRQALAGVQVTNPNKEKGQETKGAEGASSSAAYKRQPRRAEGGAGGGGAGGGGRPGKPGAKGGGILQRFLYNPTNYFIDSFDPFTFQSNNQNQDSWEKMERDPGFLYQIGMRDLDLYSRLRPLLGDTAEFNSMSWGITRSVQSGLRLPGGAKLGANYIEQGNNTHTINGYRSTRLNGPELHFDYSNLYIPPFLRNILFSMDMASGFELKKGSTGNSVKITDLNPGGIEVLTREERWNPKLRLSMNWGKTGTIRTLFTKNGSSKIENLIDQDRRALTTTDDNSFNLQYSFSAPHGINLPLLKALKLQSNVRTSIDFSQKLSQNLTQVFNKMGGIKDEIKNIDTEDITVTPTLSYDFSQVIGSLSASYNTHKDRKNGTTRVTIMMKLSVTLDF